MRKHGRIRTNGMSPSSPRQASEDFWNLLLAGVLSGAVSGDGCACNMRDAEHISFASGSH
eukprot:8157703-Karenia_brevis.AAC.1